MSHVFDIPLTTDDVAALLDKAKRLAEENGGSFIGDTQAGKFAADGVEGAYEVVGKTLHLQLFDKPWLATWSMVESAVRAFFSH